jgi:hypothetical protein
MIYEAKITKYLFKFLESDVTYFLMTCSLPTHPHPHTHTYADSKLNSFSQLKFHFHCYDDHYGTQILNSFN